MASADGAGLVSAAVRTAILANAPRRSVSAVAAAAVSAVVGTHAEAACQTQLSSERGGTPRGTERSNDDGFVGGTEGGESFTEEEEERLTASCQDGCQHCCRGEGSAVAGDVGPGWTVPACFQCSRERTRSTESTEEESEGRVKYDGSGPLCGAGNIDLWHHVQDRERRSRADPGCECVAALFLVS